MMTKKNYSQIMKTLNKKRKARIVSKQNIFIPTKIMDLKVCLLFIAIIFVFYYSFIIKIDNNVKHDVKHDEKHDEKYDVKHDVKHSEKHDGKYDENYDEIHDEMKLVNFYISTHKYFPNEIKNRSYYTILCDRKNQLKNKYALDIIETCNDNELYPKNIDYSECSKIYYIWKKYKVGEISSEYVGFFHYRRVFPFKNRVPDLIEIFSNYDVILHKELNLRMTIREHFDKYHFVEFLDEVLDIIKNNFTDYYQTALKSFIRTNFNICNIFIMKQEDFIKYGEFLFGVLMEFDKRHNLNTDEDLKNFVIQEINKTGKKNFRVNYQRRVEAFLSERISQIFYDYHFKKPLLIGVTNIK